jgi:serine/threonine protein kinase
MPVKAAQKPPQNLGRYEILEQIAEGGMGVVYKARDPVLGIDVALKVLLREIAANPVLLKRFHQEFAAASTLEHPHLVHALDFGEADGKYFIVMEYVDGISLGEGIERNGRLPEADAVRIITQAAQALQYIHDHGFVHRDVKPDNILITRDGTAKLTDIGLAKNTGANLGLTRAGKGLGTPNFMAPEQLADAKSVDRRADIYGLGATLYLAVTGELPFFARNFLNTFRKKTSGDIKSPRQLVPGLSQRLDRAVMRALSAEPAKRQQSCMEFIHELTGTDAEEEPTRGRGSRVISKKSAADRRATVRYPSSSQGVCVPLGGGEAVRWSAQVPDISSGGISLLVSRRFEPGTILTLEFSGRKSNRPDRLLVHVVRVTNQGKKKWRLGCRFGTGLGEDEVEALL